MKQENKTENKNQAEKQGRKGGAGNQTGEKEKNQIDKAERKQKQRIKETEQK